MREGPVGAAIADEDHLTVVGVVHVTPLSPVQSVCAQVPETSRWFGAPREFPPFPDRLTRRASGGDRCDRSFPRHRAEMSEWRDRIPDMNDCTLPGRTGVAHASTNTKLVVLAAAGQGDRRDRSSGWQLPSRSSGPAADGLGVDDAARQGLHPNWVARLDRGRRERDRHWVHDPITLEVQGTSRPVCDGLATTSKAS